METPSAHEKVMSYFEALVSGDRAALESVCADDFTFTVPGPSVDGLQMGGGEALDFLASVAKENFVPGSMNIAPIRCAQDADQVVIEANVTAKTLKGKEYDNWYVLWFEFRGDELAAVREHVDTKYAFDVLELG